MKGEYGMGTEKEYKKVIFDPDFCGVLFTFMLTEEQIRVFSYLIREGYLYGTINYMPEKVEWEKI